jgi:hypothetical protein
VSRNLGSLPCLLSACALFGCGSGEQTPSPDLSAPEQPYIQVDPTINVCPTFAGSLVIPEDIGPGVAAEIVILVNDPDGPNAKLAFSWSAMSGVFSKPDRPTTSYTCDALGPEALTIAARDVAGCTNKLTLNVVCVDK